MAKYRTLATMLALPLGFAVTAAPAQELTKEELGSRLNGIRAADITDAPIPGMYQVAVGANVAYVTKDGRYIFRGDIIEVETSANVSEETRARARAAMLGSVDPASMIVFKPANGAAKHTVTIFTDVDCGYCRQFHREIDKVTALGELAREPEELRLPARGARLAHARVRRARLRRRVPQAERPA